MMDDILQLESIRVGNAIFVSSLLFLFYDHLLTLDSEIRLLWRRPRNAGGYLFFVNRYLALGNIVTAIALFSTSFTASTCRSLEIFYQMFRLVTEGIVTAVFVLRVYALYGCNRAVLVIFMGIAITGTVISIWALTSQNLSAPPHLGCQIIFTPSEASWTAIAWEGLLVVDSLLFTLTMRKAYQAYISFRGYQVRNSLLSVLVRDGSHYFLIMTLTNLANIISLKVRTPLQGNFSPLVGCLSVALTSRVILNLHEAAKTGIYTPVDYTTISGIEFSSPADRID